MPRPQWAEKYLSTRKPMIEVKEQITYLPGRNPAQTSPAVARTMPMMKMPPSTVARSTEDMAEIGKNNFGIETDEQPVFRPRFGSGPSTIQYTGTGEDGQLQADKPVDMIQTDQGPKMIHEGEIKIVGKDGRMTVIPANMLPQDVLQMIEKTGNISGYATGTPDVAKPTTYTAADKAAVSKKFGMPVFAVNDAVVSDFVKKGLYTPAAAGTTSGTPSTIQPVKPPIQPPTTITAPTLGKVAAAPAPATSTPAPTWGIGTSGGTFADLKSATPKPVSVAAPVLGTGTTSKIVTPAPPPIMQPVLQKTVAAPTTITAPKVTTGGVSTARYSELNKILDTQYSWATPAQRQAFIGSNGQSIPQKPAATTTGGIPANRYGELTKILDTQYSWATPAQRQAFLGSNGQSIPQKPAAAQPTAAPTTISTVTQRAGGALSEQRKSTLETEFRSKYPWADQAQMDAYINSNGQSIPQRRVITAENSAEAGSEITTGGEPTTTEGETTTGGGSTIDTGGTTVGGETTGTETIPTVADTTIGAGGTTIGGAETTIPGAETTTGGGITPVTKPKPPRTTPIGESTTTPSESWAGGLTNEALQRMQGIMNGTSQVDRTILNKYIQQYDASSASGLRAMMQRMAGDQNLTEGAKNAMIAGMMRDIASGKSNMLGTLAISAQTKAESAARDVFTFGRQLVSDEENRIKDAYERAVTAGDYNTAANMYRQLTGKNLDTTMWEEEREYTLTEREKLNFKDMLQYTDLSSTDGKGMAAISAQWAKAYPGTPVPDFSALKLYQANVKTQNLYSGVRSLITSGADDAAIMAAYGSQGLNATTLASMRAQAVTEDAVDSYIDSYASVDTPVATAINDPELRKMIGDWLIKNNQPATAQNIDREIKRRFAVSAQKRGDTLRERAAANFENVLKFTDISKPDGLAKVQSAWKAAHPDSPVPDFNNLKTLQENQKKADMYASVSDMIDKGVSDKDIMAQYGSQGLTASALSGLRAKVNQAEASANFDKILAYTDLSKPGALATIQNAWRAAYPNSAVPDFTNVQAMQANKIKADMYSNVAQMISNGVPDNEILAQYRSQGLTATALSGLRGSKITSEQINEQMSGISNVSDAIGNANLKSLVSKWLTANQMDASPVSVEQEIRRRFEGKQGAVSETEISGQIKNYLGGANGGLKAAQKDQVLINDITSYLKSKGISNPTASQINNEIAKRFNGITAESAGVVDPSKRLEALFAGGKGYDAIKSDAEIRRSIGKMFNVADEGAGATKISSEIDNIWNYFIKNPTNQSNWATLAASEMKSIYTAQRTSHDVNAMLNNEKIRQLFAASLGLDPAKAMVQGSSAYNSVSERIQQTFATMDSSDGANAFIAISRNAPKEFQDVPEGIGVAAMDDMLASGSIKVNANGDIEYTQASTYYMPWENPEFFMNYTDWNGKDVDWKSGNNPRSASWGGQKVSGTDVTFDQMNTKWQSWIAQPENEDKISKYLVNGKIDSKKFIDEQINKVSQPQGTTNEIGGQLPDKPMTTSDFINATRTGGDLAGKFLATEMQTQDGGQEASKIIDSKDPDAGKSKYAISDNLLVFDGNSRMDPAKLLWNTDDNKMQYIWAQFDQVFGSGAGKEPLTANELKTIMGANKYIIDKNGKVLNFDPTVREKGITLRDADNTTIKLGAEPSNNWAIGQSFISQAGQAKTKALYNYQTTAMLYDWKDMFETPVSKISVKAAQEIDTFVQQAIRQDMPIDLDGTKVRFYKGVFYGDKKPLYFVDINGIKGELQSINKDGKTLLVFSPYDGSIKKQWEVDPSDPESRKIKEIK